MTMPNFLIVGAQKAGTTWVATNLSQHPMVFIPKKEIHFFDREHLFKRGASWYSKQFKGGSRAAAVGDKTPDYLWVHAAPRGRHPVNIHERIYQCLPEARLILVLRDPVARAISAARHLIRSGRVSPEVSLDSLFFGEASGLGASHGLIEKGLYSGHIAAFRQLYGPQRMKILIFERDIIGRPEGTMAELCKFLSVSTEHWFDDLNKSRNENRRTKVGLSIDYSLPMARLLRVGSLIDRVWPGEPLCASAECVAKLRALYRDEKAAIEVFLNTKIPEWAMQ